MLSLSHNLIEARKSSVAQVRLTEALDCVKGKSAEMETGGAVYRWAAGEYVADCRFEFTERRAIGFNLLHISPGTDVVLSDRSLRCGRF